MNGHEIPWWVADSMARQNSQIGSAYDVVKRTEQRYDKLIWLIVRQCGGEVRIPDIEHARLIDDWGLVCYTDPVTQEYVLQSVRRPDSTCS